MQSKVHSSPVLLASVITVAINLAAVAADRDFDRGMDLERNLQAINQHFGTGVTPGDNAVVLIYKSLGPHPGGATLPVRFFKELGIPVPPDRGDYFQPYLKGASADADPGFKQFDKAIGELWTRKECPIVAKWLDANVNPVEVMIEASQRSQWYSPIIPPSDEAGKTQGLVMTLLPATQEIRSIARYFSIRANLAMAESRFDDAWDDVLNCHRLGRMQSKGPTVIDYLVGVAITNIANVLHVRFMQVAQPDSKTLVAMRDEFRALPELKRPVDQVEITERVMLLDLYSTLEAGDYEAFDVFGISSTSESLTPTVRAGLALVDWDVARFHGMQVYGELRTLLQIKDPIRRADQMAEFDARLNTRGTVTSERIFNAFLKKGDVTGTIDTLVADYLIQQFLPAMAQVENAAARTFARIQNLETYFALEMYRQRTGEYPESLSELVPEWMEVEPVDPYIGRPLKYKRKSGGFLLYSVGLNRTDEKGRTFGEDGDDLRIKVLPGRNKDAVSRD